MRSPHFGHLRLFPIHSCLILILAEHEAQAVWMNIARFLGFGAALTDKSLSENTTISRYRPHKPTNFKLSGHQNNFLVMVPDISV